METVFGPAPLRFASECRVWGARFMKIWPPPQIIAAMERWRHTPQGAVFSGSTKHLVDVGLLDPKAPPDVYNRLGQAYTVAVFIFAVALPTWPSEPIAVFTAFLALAVAWLLAVPLTMDSICNADLALLSRGFRQWRNSIVATAKERGVSLDTTSSDGPPPPARIPRLLTPLAPFAVLQLMFRQSTRSVALGVIAIVGLLAGPTLATVHVGYWSPVSLIFGLSVPLAGRLMFVLVLPVMFQVYLAGLRANEAVQRIQRRRDDS